MKAAIDGVLCSNVGIDHQDSRRALYTFFNGPSEMGFLPPQIKILDILTDCSLGNGHFHDYMEAFILASANPVTFYLEHVDTRDRMLVQLTQRGRLIIPPRVGHEVSAMAGALLIGGTELPFREDDQNIRPYGINREDFSGLEPIIV